MSTFLLSSPAGHLEVITTESEKNNAAVAIICHPNPTQQGTMNNKVVTTLARALQQLGLHTVRFNFRGVGNSTGSFGQTIGEREDLVTVINWVKQTYPNHPIWLAGFSFGSYIAAATANQHPEITQLISIAPPVNMYDFQALSHIVCPWLIITGDADELVPFDQVRQFVKQSPLSIDFIPMPGVGHFFHGKLIELREQMKNHWSVAN